MIPGSILMFFMGSVGTGHGQLFTIHITVIWNYPLLTWFNFGRGMNKHMTSIMKCEMKLLTHYQTSIVQSLKIENG